MNVEEAAGSRLILLLCNSLCIFVHITLTIKMKIRHRQTGVAERPQHYQQPLRSLRVYQAYVYVYSLNNMPINSYNWI